jgi:hypothetical protein
MRETYAPTAVAGTDDGDRVRPIPRCNPRQTLELARRLRTIETR